MAVKAACARAFIDIFHRRVPFTAFSAHQGIQHPRHFVSVSQHYLSPQPPKRPQGAFLDFLRNKTPEISRKYPDVGFTERAKIAGLMWHELDPEERDRLKLAAREEFQAYRQNYLIFMDGLSDQERAQLVQQKKAKKEMRAKHKHKMELRKFGRPKRPANAFALFMRSSRLERGNAQATQFTKGLAEYWNQMPLEEKDIYVEDARLEKAKYEQEMKEWEERMKEIGREDLIRRQSQTKPKKVVATKAKKKTAASKKKKTARKTKKSSSKTSNVKKKTISKEVQTEE